MRLPLNRLILLCLAAAIAACQLPSEESAGAAEAVRAADVAWSKTFQEKDAEAGGAFMAPDGIVMPPNMPKRTGGPPAFGGLVEGFFALPGFAGGWQPTSVTVARSGELAYSVGTYDLSWNGPGGRKVGERGKYVTVWRKQPDGQWKVAVDIFNADAPPPE